MSDSLPESNSVKVINPQHVPRIVKDITGHRFGLWLVLRFHEFKRAKNNWIKLWWCQCECGTEKPVRAADLISGGSASCGCQGLAERVARASDLTGQVFGRLTVLSFAGHRVGRRIWLCRCECGTEKEITGHELRNGDSNSCGCFHREATGDRFRTHGKHGTRAYRIWAGMKTRCENPNANGYQDYGGKGVKVCERWQTFGGFLADMGKCPSKDHTIDRIDSNGDYCPENCRWLPRGEQNSNTSRNRVYEANGESLTLQQWADRLGINPTSIINRIVAGWTLEKAVTEPKRNNKNCGKRGGKLYMLWWHIRARCHSPTSTSYHQYGAKGVRMCERWRGSFKAFEADMGPRPSSAHSVDRIDPTGGYCPENCRWATHIEQGNNRIKTVFLELNGRRMSAAQWARELGVSSAAIHHRRRKGWTDTEILSTPFKRP